MFAYMRTLYITIEEVTMRGRFGQFAKAQRIEAEISLRTVARELGLTPSYVSDIERGHRNPPDPNIVRKWAAIVGGDPEAFDRIARVDRAIIEFSVDPEEMDSARNDALVALARRSATLTDEQWKQIADLLRRDNVQGSE
jgi:transcriptional regulator with XRE-family HTH domain